MLLTRKAEFSASHVCRNPSWSEEENKRVYGTNANPNGHGHNYVIEVTVEGPPDRVTGMVFDLKILKEIMNQEVVEPMDHRFLNKEVSPFERVVPTTENIAVEIWHRLEPRLANAGAHLRNVRLYETQDLFVDYGGEPCSSTRRYRFAASHRLHTPALSDEENRRLYGKCNNPHGHGHDYVVDVTVEGPPAADGQIANRAALDDLIRDRVLSQLDHKNLNEDRPEFRADVPTTENLAMLVRDLLKQNWTLAPKLKTIRISETERNTFTLPV